MEGSEYAKRRWGGTGRSPRRTNKKMNKIYLKTAETYDLSFLGMRTLMATQENFLKVYIHTRLDGLKIGFIYYLHINKSIAIKDKRPQP